MGVKRAQIGEVGGFGSLLQISQGAPQPSRSMLIVSRLYQPGIKPLDELLEALILPGDLACK